MKNTIIDNEGNVIFEEEVEELDQVLFEIEQTEATIADENGNVISEVIKDEKSEY